MTTTSVQWIVIELIGNVLTIYRRLTHQTSAKIILPSIPGRIEPPWPRTPKRTFFGHGDPVFLFLLLFLRLRPHSQPFSRSTIHRTLTIRSTAVVHLSFVSPDLTTASISPRLLSLNDVLQKTVQKTDRLLCPCFPISGPNRCNQWFHLFGTVHTV